MEKSSFMPAFLITLLAVNVVDGRLPISEEVSPNEIVRCKAESDCKNFKCRYAPYPCLHLHSECYAGLCWCSCRKAPPKPNESLN
ncbi:unnamed protein product [Lupinus luteus]|uniref:Uncharacterized protein n=1 Tax=Lupinus luteus TaxID=3873 RepID=A0AAV1WNL3_LUPLU